MSDKEIAICKTLQAFIRWDSYEPEYLCLLPVILVCAIRIHGYSDTGSMGIATEDCNRGSFQEMRDSISKSHNRDIYFIGSDSEQNIKLRASIEYLKRNKIDI